MQEPDSTTTEETAAPASPGRRDSDVPGLLLWALAFLCVAAYAVIRIDLFPLTTELVVDGMSIDVPRMFFTIDHPFHIVRSQLLADAWKSFEFLRWVPSHQGGYPAEFYPFGAAGIVVALHFLTLGGLAIESAYTLMVVGLFLLPGLAYWLVTRAERSSPGVALLAFTGHVAIASLWLQGGYIEIVEWGLVANAAGSVLALLALPLLIEGVQGARTRWALLAAGSIALAVVSNPRSLMAVLAVALAMLVRTLLFGDRRLGMVARLGGVGLLTVAVCAPVLFPLVRYSDYYVFVHYREYATIGAYLVASVETVTLPIAVLAVVGTVVSFLNSTHRVSQVASIAFMLYVLLTALAIGAPWVQNLVPQLELPRLMPFQRLLMIYLAGYATVELVRMAVRMAGRREAGVAVAALGAATLLVVFTTDMDHLQTENQGLRPVPRIEGSAAAELVNMRRAVEEADEIAREESAILVLGSTLSSHQQLWAPGWSDRRFYYNDWLWYWHPLHEGPYDYREGHRYPNPSESISADYLRTHGIGAVVVTDLADETGGGSARAAAASSDLLRREGSFGDWEVYAVEGASPLATLNGTAPDRLNVSPNGERITLSFADAQAGSILVRQNWFPRWTASINGESVAVNLGTSGYIEIPTTGGDIDVELTYSLTTLDSVGRVLSIVGIVTILTGLIAGPTPIRGLARRSGWAGRG